MSKVFDTDLGRIFFLVSIPPRLLRSYTFYGASVMGSSSLCMAIHGCLGGVEDRLTRYIVRSLRDDEIFYDIGAHIGYYSILASIISPSGKVIAFEPNPYVYRVLKANIAMANSSNIDALPYAVSNKTGTSTLVIPASVYAATGSLKDVHTWIYRMSDYRVVRVKVPTITIDYFVNRSMMPPSFIKIDVEGAEDLVVQGARKTLKEYCPRISMEVWRLARAPHYRASAILYNLGYKSYAIDKNDRLVRVDLESFLENWMTGFFDNLVFTC